jgi:REP element-mobilizing transposase RayT
MGRGIEGNKIFISDKDREDFIARLSAMAEEGAMDVYAWALLPNHFHMLAKTKNRALSSSMRKILTGYAVNFNKRHKRHGHLFQNRYKSIVCQEEAYLRELVRYIHLNLLRAGIVKDSNGLERSRWSGHSALMGKVERKWQDTEYVLSFFGNGRAGRRNYRKYIEDGIGLGRRPELVGGGLIRSLGGWSEVLSLRERGERHAFDQRILGDSDFVQGVTSGLDNMVKRNLRLSAQRIDIETLAERVCKRYDISAGELRCGSRRGNVVKARQVLFWFGVRELGYSGAELARHFGVSTSCVNRFISSGKKPDTDFKIHA